MIMFKLIVIGSFSLLMTGCGLLGGSAVPKEQLNADLGKSVVKVSHSDGTSEVEWDFKDDNLRCFAPSGDKDSVTETTADISLNVSSIVTSRGSGGTPVMFGKFLLHYKKDGDKWKLESIEPKEAKTNEIEGDKFSNYVDLQLPLCNFYKYADFEKNKG